ncbi:MAG: contractile injection system tape measure protein [Candidatus Chryseobacterium colombiense]|nr:contractile injection system tape measure protein [Chryseobacterium sp.]WEK71057.1 MAG: contractile injection system tape measure protein [Chryseobacterium sp.]
MEITQNSKIDLNKGIIIRNAGIVILNNSFGMLFERLGLSRENKFTSLENQSKAAQFLQYIATGVSITEDIDLPLDKVLCGLPISHSIPDTIEITAENEVIINSLMQSTISQWNTIGDSSLDGFRGNWLIRDGILTELSDKWELTINKRAYDILINKSPFSFSIIKYPWMKKPLHVTWPY